MFTIHSDVQMTRRKRLHFILDGADEVRWTGASVYAAIEWLFENGEVTFKVAGEFDQREFKLNILAH